MLSNLKFGFELIAIGIPLVFLSLGIIATLFEVLKRKFKVEEVKTEKVSKELSDKELIAAIAAIAAYTSLTTFKKPFKAQVSFHKKLIESEIPIWNLAGRIELTS